MPARNMKGIIMGRNRAGLERAISRPDPSLDINFGLLNQFLCFTTLSRKNILWGAKHVQALREHPKWFNDVEAQSKIDRLEALVAEAKARLQRRAEKSARLRAESAPKADGRRKRSASPASGRPGSVEFLRRGQCKTTRLRERKNS